MLSQANSRVARPLPVCPQDSASPSWSALVEDTGVSVLVLDAEGVILFVNERAATEFAKQPQEILGRNYAELVPADFGAERLAFFRRVAETSSPMVIDHTYGGRRRRMSLRPFAADGEGTARVLMICRPALEDERTTASNATIVQAKCNDLGMLSALTPRELEILCLIGQGMATADIAKHLHRSEKTVEWHRVSLGNKLGVSNRVELARIAIKSGLVAPAARTEEHA